MAASIHRVGSFIPNKAGNPKILTLSPAERAEFLAAKHAAKEKKAEEAARADSIEAVDGSVSIEV